MGTGRIVDILRREIIVAVDLLAVGIAAVRGPDAAEVPRAYADLNFDAVFVQPFFVPQFPLAANDLHADVVRVRAPDLDGQLAVVVDVRAGLDPDRILAVVRKDEVRGAPVDRGVQPRQEIADEHRVGMALVDLEIGVLHGVVQRGGHLADAAAVAHRVVRAAVNGGQLEAGLLGALADDVVVREALARHEHLAVKAAAGQLDV